MRLYSKYRPKKVAFLLVTSVVISTGIALFLVFAAVNPDCWLHDEDSKCRSDEIAVTEAFIGASSTPSTSVPDFSSTTDHNNGDNNGTEWTTRDATKPSSWPTSAGPSTVYATNTAGQLETGSDAESSASSVSTPLPAETDSTLLLLGSMSTHPTSQESQSTATITSSSAMTTLERTTSAMISIGLETVTRSGSSSPLPAGETTGSSDTSTLPSTHGEGSTKSSMHPSSALTMLTSQAMISSGSDYSSTPEPCVDPASEDCMPTVCPPGLPIGGLPAPCHDCQHYFFCLSSAPHLISCDSGQLFDINTSGCKPEADATCIPPLNVCKMGAGW